MSVDAKSVIQALDRTQPLGPIDFGKSQKRTFDSRADGDDGSVRCYGCPDGQGCHVTVADAHDAGFSALHTRSDCVVI